MKTNIIYIGNIRKITSYKLSDPIYYGNNIVMRKSKVESECLKSDATLIEISPNTYVDIDNINSMVELLLLKACLKFQTFYPEDINRLLLSTDSRQLEGTLYIESLIKHPLFNCKDTVSFNKLKRFSQNKK